MVIIALVFFFWSAFLAQGSPVLFLLLSDLCLGAGSSGMRAARISHVRSACEVGIGCARADLPQTSDKGRYW